MANEEQLEQAPDPGKVPNHHKILTSFVAGAFAGALAKSSIAPLDRTKINFQVSSRRFSTKAALRFLFGTWKHEGFTALWRGNSATMVRIVPYAAITFSSHEQWKYVLHKLDSQPKDYLHPMQRFLAGALAGITATTCVYPLDLVRARMAVTKKHTYHSMPSVVIKTWQNEGLLSLYRGFTPSILGIIPYAGTSFFTFETLKKFHSENLGGPITPLHRMCYGACSGACGQALTYPLDIVRRRMQTAGVIPGKENLYPTIWGTVKHILQEEGLIRGLYKGISLNWIKGPIVAGISFMTFETTQEHLRKYSIFHG